MSGLLPIQYKYPLTFFERSIMMKITKLFLVLALALTCATVQAWDDPVTLTANSALYSVNGLTNGSVTSYHDTYDADYYGSAGWLFSTGSLPGTATYDFGSAIELSNLVLWNWSGDWQDATDRGAQNFTVSFSDDGSTFTGEVAFVAAEAISASAEPSQVFMFPATTARYARITVTSNYGSADWAGIGVARFNDTHIPVEPTPSDGATGVARDVTLSWTPYNAGAVIDYDVYFGTDPNVTTVLLTDSTDTTVDPTPGVGELLDFGTTYYWRVDTNYQILPVPNEPNMLSQLFSFEIVAASPVVTDITPLVRVVDSDGTGTAEFTVTGTNIDFYEWYKEGTASPLANSGNISGADTATLSITNVQEADEGKYYCVVSNSSTIDTDQSDSATLMLKKLVAHWTFDSTLADSAGPWDGTWSGTSPTYVSGADGDPNGAIAFDGTDYVDVAGSETALQFQETGITIAAWIYNIAVGDTGSYMRALSKRTDYELVAHDNGSIRSALWDGATERLDNPTGGNDGQWRLVVLAYDTDTGEMIVANVAEVPGMGIAGLDSGRQTVTIGTDATPEALRIGASSESMGGSVYPLDGFYLDDVRLYNYALSNIEIALLAGDINGDCEVNLDDFAAMAATWLNDNFLN